MQKLITITHQEAKDIYNLIESTDQNNKTSTLIKIEEDFKIILGRCNSMVQPLFLDK